MVRPDGYVKVLDFGLAKLTEQRTRATHTTAPTMGRIDTAPGTVVGTANYLSPEQARGLDVDARAGHRVGAVSAGQQQRVLIARALVSEPEVLMLDEPTGGIDPETQASFYALLQQLNRERGVTLVLVSHEPRPLLNAILGLTEMMVTNAARFGTEKSSGTAAPCECRWHPSPEPHQRDTGPLEDRSRQARPQSRA